MDARIRDGLVERLLDLLAFPCTAGEEAALADHLQAVHDGLPVTRVRESLVVGEPDARPTVLLVGHLDVVPPTDEDREPRVEDREDGLVVVGRGASDMKGGLAVAQALLADDALRARSPYGLALVLYAGEEGPDEGNQLTEVLARLPWLRDAALAVVLEPTDLEVQAGCLGGLHAELTFRGRAAHSARPWHGENALTKAGEFLALLHALAPRDVEVDGVAFREVWSATQAHTDNSRNVIPDRFVVNLNYRFAPSRTLAEAEAQLHDLVGDRAEVAVVDRAAPAPPRLDAPIVGELIDALGAPIAAKQAWTDVARFAEAGVPAVNFGPGLTTQAHQAGEHVPVANLVAAWEGLRRFLLP